MQAYLLYAEEVVAGRDAAGDGDGGFCLVCFVSSRLCCAAMVGMFEQSCDGMQGDSLVLGQLMVDGVMAG